MTYLSQLVFVTLTSETFYKTTIKVDIKIYYIDFTFVLTGGTVGQTTFSFGKHGAKRN